MTRLDHLLTTFAEEAVEVAQRATKALRFGIHEIQPGQFKTNAERLKGEFLDLLAVYGLLCQEGYCEPVAPMDQPAIDRKQSRLEEYLELSDQQGRLTHEAA